MLKGNAFRRALPIQLATPITVSCNPSWPVVRWLSSTGLDVVTDLICAGIPIFVIHRLQMNIQTKLAVGFLMSLGVLSVARKSKQAPEDDQLTCSRTAGCAIAKAVTLQGLFGADYTCKPDPHHESCSH